MIPVMTVVVPNMICTVGRTRQMQAGDMRRRVARSMQRVGFHTVQQDTTPWYLTRPTETIISLCTSFVLRNAPRKTCVRDAILERVCAQACKTVRACERDVRYTRQQRLNAAVMPFFSICRWTTVLLHTLA
ncbi:unnamed protein product, partial [Ectocarpus sp. 12 AP-2014]